MSVLFIGASGSMAQQTTLVSFEKPSSRTASFASIAKDTPNATDATTQQTLATRLTQQPNGRDDAKDATTRETLFKNGGEGDLQARQ